MRGPEQRWFQHKVAVIDSCTQVRGSFQFCFPALQVVGAFATVEEFLDSGIDCDLVVVDMVLHDSDASALSGPSAVEALVSANHRVCVYSAERRVLVLARCLAAGVAGLVNKSDPLNISGEVFATALQGSTAIATSLGFVRDLVARRGVPPTLTMRQRQVLHARARGESWQQLAERLGISAKTAYDRLECARSKLSWFLQDAGLGPDPSPADIEYALGLLPAHTVPESSGERKRSA